MDKRAGTDVGELGPRADLRELIGQHLGLPLDSGPKVLVLADAHDLDVSCVGVELLKRGVDYIRLNSEDLASRSSISLTRDGRTSEASTVIDFEEVTSAQVLTVWARHMSLESLGLKFEDPIAAMFALREWQAAIRAFAGSFECSWVNHPDAVAAASDKLLQLRLASQVDLDIPRTVMTNDPSKVRAFYDAAGGEIIAKAVSLHYLEGDGRFFNFFARRLRPEDLNLIGSVRYVPCIFQEYVAKRFEVRVTIVGDKLFAVELHSQVNESTRDDYHRGSIKDLPKSVHYLPPEVEGKCRLLMRRMGLLFGGIDLILTPEGRYVFLEVNPDADWRWLESETDLRITQAVVDLLIDGPTSSGGEVGRTDSRKAALSEQADRGPNS